MSANSKRRGPWRITFDTNPDQCNINCIMCEEHSKYKKSKSDNLQNRLMDVRIVEKVIEDAVPYGLKEIIPSTMGEPLLYSDFEKIIDLVKKHGLKLNLTTNGTFPRLGVEQWGKLILPVASDVKISINGASKDTAEFIMEGINFEKQLRNIKNFVEIRDSVRKVSINNPTITFQPTYMERNLEELPDLLRLAIDLDIDRFKGHHLWITHSEVKEESLRRNTDAIQRWNKIVKKLREISEKYKLRNGKKIILENVYELNDLKNLNLVPEDWRCPFLGKEAWIAWDGTFNVCCAPDNLRQSFGFFGNVNESNFMDLWNNNKYSNFIENWGKYDVCKICNMRKPETEIRKCLYERK